MSLMLVIFGVWFVCGFLAYGITYAYFQRKYSLIASMSRDSDKRHALFVACFGPIGLFVSYFYSGFARYGLHWKD